jgi:Tfp pilus assembly protein PilF
MHWHNQQLIAREAMQLHRDGNNAEAARVFRQLINEGCRDPKVLSYGGLLVATEEGDVKTGLAWCERAVEMAFYDPQMYVNLARLHERTGWKTQAAQVLRKGLRIDPDNEKLLVEINRVSPRTPDVIPALPRDHVINRTLGKMRSKDKNKRSVKPKTSPSYS